MPTEVLLVSRLQVFLLLFWLSIVEPQRPLMVVVFVLNPAAKFKSVRDVLCVSSLELQNLTGLSPADVQQLLTTAATACRPHPPVSGLSHTHAHVTE